MSRILSRLSQTSPWLDKAAGTLKTISTPIVGPDAPKPLKDVLYGVWLGHPLHPSMTDIPVGSWTMTAVFDLAGQERAADTALKIGVLGALGSAVTGIAQWYDLQEEEEPRRLGALHALAKVGREGEAPALLVGLDELLEPGLPDRHHSAVERVDLRLVLVDAGHVVAEIGKTGAGHQTDIARPDHRNTHSSLLLGGWRFSQRLSRWPARCPPLHKPPMRYRGKDLTHMTLRRNSTLRPWVQFAIRMAILFGLLVFIVSFHWIERDSLKDNLDGYVSFTDVIYFTMISATTTGYGDIVPVTDQARMFDALIVTPIRIFFILVLAGTAYTFVIKKTWNRWIMKRIQRNLSDHIVLAGHGVSNGKALEELLARGVDSRSIVVIDSSPEALDRAADCGVAVLQGDAARDETLRAAHVERAKALLVSAGRDDSAILIVLTARKISATLNISVTIRECDNEDIARQAGADTVINPVSFAGLLLASSLQGPYRAEYLADLATTEGKVMLRERSIEDEEVGLPLSKITTGQPVRLVRNGIPYSRDDRIAQSLEEGDWILEIVEGNGQPA